MGKSALVEAVAAALWADWQASPICSPDIRGISWDDVLRWASEGKDAAKAFRDSAHGQARSALKAIETAGFNPPSLAATHAVVPREPTEAMLEHASLEFGTADWRAVIEAAEAAQAPREPGE